MLGQTIREARIRKGLTQARLARMAGVSRRHLAALEKGANISVSILQRVATVLELSEVRFGQLALRPAELPEVNVPLLTDVIREARAGAERANAILARAESILGSGSERSPQFDVSFPRMPIRQIDVPAAPAADLIRERPDLVERETAGEIRQGEPVNESARERVALPRGLVDDDEIVFRFRGDALQTEGISDGDLLIVESRPRGRAANAELVISRIGEQLWIGRWWHKGGQKRLMANGMSEVITGRANSALKVIGAVNQIVRGL